MKCPFCAGEMQSGIIKFDGRAPLRWISEDTPKSGLDRFWDALGGVGTLTAGQCSIWGAGELQADYCVTCKKMIFETNITK